MTDVSGYLPHPDAPPMMAHQREAFLRTRGEPLHALFFEQRTGKSRVVIDTAAWNYENKRIDAVLVIAMPSGVLLNWEHDEIPRWLPPRIPRRVLTWRAASASSKWFQRAADDLNDTSSLAWLLVNGEAIITDAFRAYARRFFARVGRVMVVADESSLICPHPGSKRSKLMHAIARQPMAVMRRILDGTPSAEGPLDLYSQMKFLDPAILGHTTFTSYKAHYARWERRTNHRTGYDYDQLLGYQNLDELTARLKPHATRVLRADVWDAPPKTYEFLRYEMSPQQARVYASLRDQYEAELHTGETVTAAMVLVRYTRLQQCLSNFMPSPRRAAPCPECRGADLDCYVCAGVGAIVDLQANATAVDPDDHPRLQALAGALRKRSAPAIVWCRFDLDVDATLALARTLGVSAAAYDGRSSSDEKLDAKEGFQAGRYDIITAKVSSAGRGLPFHRARDLYFYTNTFSMKDRLQAEDRAEHAAKRTSTTIIDLRAEGTIDDLITDAYRSKESVAATIMRQPKGRFF